MKKYRRRNHKKKKTIIVVLFVSMIFFFAIGYGVLSQKLTVTGHTTTIPVADGYNCSVTSLTYNKLDVSITNTHYSTTNGYTVITVTNNTTLDFSSYSYLIEIPEDFRITSSWSGEPTTKDGYILVHGPSYASSLAAGASAEFHFQFETSEANFNFDEGNVAAFGNEETTDYVCQYGKWYLNGQQASNPVQSANSTLTSLSLSNAQLSPPFLATKTSYTASVANSVTQTTINGTTTDTNATVAGLGTKNLNVGANIFDVVVTGTDGTSTTYRITITRASAGVGPGVNFGNNNVFANYAIRYNSGNTYQFDLVITNNTNEDISNWKVMLDLGTGGGLDNMWSAVTGKFDASSGLLTINYQSGNDYAYAVIEAGTSITLNGQLTADYQPKIVLFTY